MQFGDEKKTTSIAKAAMAILMLLSATFAGLTGCSSTSGSSTPKTTHAIVVADASNNRVLFYSTPFSTGESATAVLGQAGFTTSGAALSASGTNTPVATAEDSAGNIYVADNLNNRVLQFKAPITSGESATVAIGQLNFTSGTANLTQNGLSGPGGMAFDSSGNLWVVDFSNNRVLEYEPPFATDMNASLVIGQPNFTTGTAAVTSSGLDSPEFLTFDGSGNLWVSDLFNNRVLEFKPPFSNGMTASVVIGQADFVSSGAATTASGLTFPTGVVFDSSGNLWIGDTGNSRVLQFQPPFSNGMSASLVLGQANFTSSTSATTQDGFSGAFGLTFDTSGNLWVADNGNSRTLEFTPPFSTSQNATLVLGQANFTSSTAAATASGQNSPTAVTAAF